MQSTSRIPCDEPRHRALVRLTLLDQFLRSLPCENALDTMRSKEAIGIADKALPVVIAPAAFAQLLRSVGRVDRRPFFNLFCVGWCQKAL